MINATMCVCGAQAYFDMAEYSIPNFLEENLGSKLTVFSNETERLGHLVTKKNRLELRDFDDSLKNLVGYHKTYADKIMEESNGAWDNHGMNHEHKYVAVLPILADYYITSAFILKVDVDSYWKGDLMIKVIGQLIHQFSATNAFSDLYLVDRPDNGVIKSYGGGLPGVGFLMWPKKSRFIDKYVDKFDGNEQTTVLGIANELDTGIYRDWLWHVTYPYIKNPDFDIESLEPPYYVHLNAVHAREKLEILNG